MMSAFGALYKDASLEKCKYSVGFDHVRALERWVDLGRGFVVFAGCPGSGKTFLCAAVYYHLLAKTTNVRHLPIRQLMYELKEAMNEGASETKESLLNKYQRVGTLILDDLGATQNTEWQREVIFDLIDYRYQHAKSTLITTNLKYDGMCKALDERIASRVYDKSNHLMEDWKTNRRKKPE